MAAIQALHRFRDLGYGVTSCSAGRTKARGESTARLLWPAPWPASLHRRTHRDNYPHKRPDVLRSRHVAVNKTSNLRRISCIQDLPTSPLAQTKRRESRYLSSATMKPPGFGLALRLS